MQIILLLVILVSAALAAASSGATTHPQSFPAPRQNHELFRPTTNETAPNFTFDELLALQKKFWDAFIYPANVAQVSVVVSEHPSQTTGMALYTT